MELNSAFLQRRPRRNRASESIRELVRETYLAPGHLVLPLFLVEGQRIHQQIPSLPVAARMSLDNILKNIETAMSLGVNSFMIFPAVPEEN